VRAALSFLVQPGQGHESASSTTMSVLWPHLPDGIGVNDIFSSLQPRSPLESALVRSGATSAVWREKAKRLTPLGRLKEQVCVQDIRHAF